MANLAIKGHATRGKEVIEILEMLGGVINGKLLGTEDFCAYYIDSDSSIDYKHYSRFDDAIQFTLEEFLEKFPYKVGDKVIIKRKNQEAIVDKVVWCCDTITYWLKYNGFIEGNWKAEHLQPYKEETMEEEEENFAEGIEETMKEIKIEIPKGYEFAGVDDDNQQVVFTKIQLEYPKTYEECCEIMGIEYPVVGGKPDGLSASTYRITEIRPFIYLLICRDAYWKIAGWNPKVKSDVFYMHTLPSYLRDLFPMPTEEMRGAFYENFKELIEQCKELL